MKIKYMLGLIVLGVMLSGCINTPDVKNTTTTLPKAEPQHPVVTTITNPNAAQQDAAFEDYLVKFKQKRMFRGNDSVPDRASYGISTKVFDLLPPVPNDFLYKVYLIKYGRFVNVGELGPEYYKQPEFDPDFTKFGLRYWEEWKDENYTKKHWGTVGIRSYPFSQHIMSKPGYSFNIMLFISANWNIETYQGIRLTTRFLDKAFTEDGKAIVSSPNASMYVHANITPNEFLLTPAFPQFTDNWVQKVNVVGKVSENSPKGTYILSMEVGKPEQKNSDKWLLQYLNLYSEGVEMIQTDKPYLQAFIYVQ